MNKKVFFSSFFHKNIFYAFNFILRRCLIHIICYFYPFVTNFYIIIQKQTTSTYAKKWHVCVYEKTTKIKCFWWKSTSKIKSAINYQISQGFQSHKIVFFFIKQRNLIHTLAKYYHRINKLWNEKLSYMWWWPSCVIKLDNFGFILSIDVRKSCTKKKLFDLKS